MLEANRTLRDAIDEVAANPQAVRVLAQGRLFIEALRLRFGYGTGRDVDVVAEHRALCGERSRRATRWPQAGSRAGIA